MHQSHGPGTLQKLHNMNPNISKINQQLQKKELIGQIDGVKLKLNEYKKKQTKRDKNKKEKKIINQQINQIDIFAGG